MHNLIASSVIKCQKLPIIFNMANNSLIHIILEVLKNPSVIVTAVLCMIAMNLSCYIVRYRKTPKTKKSRNFSAPAPAKPSETAKDDSSNASGEGTGDDEYASE